MDDQDNERADAPYFEPIFGTMYDDLDAARQQLAVQHASQDRLSRLRLRIFVERTRVSAHWLTIVLWGASVLAAAVAIVLFSASWPWQATQTSDDQSAAVLACATIVALGVIILSAIMAPVERAAVMGPGFTSALLQRPAPWLIGLAVAPVTVFLIWLATLPPDSDAALASAFLTASLFGAFWSASRASISLLDPLGLTSAIVRQSRRNVRRLARSGERMGELAIASSAPDDSRQAFIDSSRLRLATGGIRHLESAVTWAVREGKSHEATALWEAMIDEIVWYARSYEGAIGRQGGMADVVVGALPSVCVGLDNAGDRVAARQAAQQAARLMGVTNSHIDASYSRSAVESAFVRLVEAYWSDDNSEVPANAVLSISSAFQLWVGAGLYRETESPIGDLFRILERSYVERRLHIEMAASEGAVRCFAAALGAPPTLREYHLSNWLDHVVREGYPSISSDRLNLFQPGKRLVPGQGLHGPGLQDVIVRINDLERFEAAASTVRDMLEHMLPDLLALEHRPDIGGGPAGDSLVLALSAMLQGIALQSAGIACAASGSGAALVNTAVNAIERAADERRAPLLRHSGFVEALWSLMLAGGTLDGSERLVCDAASALRPLLPSGPVHDGHVRRFIAGIHLAAGDDAASVDQLVDSLRPGGFRGYMDGPDFHYPALGRANACNRNRTVHWGGAPEAVDRWALTTFPDFAAR